MELKYPEHEHPHGVENTSPDGYRIWVCTECEHVFSDSEVRQNTAEWGHPCKQTGQRCESHLEPYVPGGNPKVIEEMVEALKDAQRYVGIYAHNDPVARRLNDNFAYLIEKYSAVVEDDEREQEERENENTN